MYMKHLELCFLFFFTQKGLPTVFARKNELVFSPRTIKTPVVVAPHRNQVPNNCLREGRGLRSFQVLGLLGQTVGQVCWTGEDLENNHSGNSTVIYTK